MADFYHARACMTRKRISTLTSTRMRALCGKIFFCNRDGGDVCRDQSNVVCACACYMMHATVASEENADFRNSRRYCEKCTKFESWRHCCLQIKGRMSVEYFNGSQRC